MILHLYYNYYNTLETVISYELQLQIIDEPFSFRDINNILEEIINVFQSDNKERTRPRSFFHKLDLRKQEIMKLRYKTKLQNPIG